MQPPGTARIMKVRAIRLSSAPPRFPPRRAVPAPGRALLRGIDPILVTALPFTIRLGAVLITTGETAVKPTAARQSALTPGARGPIFPPLRTVFSWVGIARRAGRHPAGAGAPSL